MAASLAPLSALTRLTCLAPKGLLGSSLGVLLHLNGLRVLVLDDCSLDRLPPQLTGLAALTHLNLSRNPDIQLSKADLYGVLARLTSLQELHLDRNVAQSVRLSDWMQLGRMCLDLRCGSLGGHCWSRC